MKDIKTIVSERLKESRKAVGLTQKQVAEHLNKTQQQYSLFENGVYELNYEQIVIICKLFDISSDYLFGIKEF